jgi:alkylation response protein AidB-like acyl-CoA dehydrogenase
MDPRDSASEAAFRAEARTWLETNARRHRRPPIAPSAIVSEWSPEEERERLSEARAWQRRKYEAGWAGIAYPREYGGRGGTLVEQLIFLDEESAFDVPRDALVVGLGWCGPALLIHGSQAQRLRFLPPMLSGDEVWCQLFSEPGAGSDLAGLATRAERDGDDWMLTGEKVWTTFAHLSDWGLCVARHDPELTKHRGLSAFIVDMRASGLEVRPLRQMTGAANFNQVRLEEVRVPDDRRVGEVGDGWPVVITTFMYERVGGGLAGAGVLAATDGLPSPTAVERDRRVRAHIVDRLLYFNRLRLMTSLHGGGIPGPEGSLGKLLATQMLTSIYDQALFRLGASGMLAGGDAPADGEWQNAFLGTPGLRIGGGTDHIQRNIIGERVLGLPGEIRVDREGSFRSLSHPG